MTYPSRKPSPPKPPEWIVRVTRSLRGELSPDAYKRAMDILHHSKTGEAREILNRGWDGDYPHLAEIIKVCALCNGPPMEVPFIFYDKQEQAKQAKAAKNLLKAIERLSRRGMRDSIRSGALMHRIFNKLGEISSVPPDLYERSRQEAERETPNIPNAIIN